MDNIVHMGTRAQKPTAIGVAPDPFYPEKVVWLCKTTMLHGDLTTSCSPVDGELDFQNMKSNPPTSLRMGGNEVGGSRDEVHYSLYVQTKQITYSYLRLLFCFYSKHYSYLPGLGLNDVPLGVRIILYSKEY